MCIRDRSFCEQWVQQKPERNEQRGCPVEPQPTDRFTDTCGAPFGGLPEELKDILRVLNACFYLGYCNRKYLGIYINISFKVWKNNVFLGKCNCERRQEILLSVVYISGIFIF